MTDQAHDWTDEQIEALERKFNSTYSQAEREMRAKLDEYLRDFDEKNRVWQAEVRAGKATHEQYQGWLKSQSLRRDYLSDMCDTLAQDASRTNQLAFDMINDELPRIYAENANYAAYSIESQLHSNTHAFDLVDQSTVRRMMGLDDDGQVIKEVVLSEEEVSPPLRTLRKVNVKKAKDVRWNRQKFNAALTQSILQGESIPNTAKRMARVLNMDKNMAVRAARTAMTSAENAGRVDSYHRAKGIGIDLEQEWLATLDERTRHSHRELDGQHVPVGEKFKVPSSGNELEFPADPTAKPSEVWNCRCTLVAWFPEDAEESLEGRFSRLPDGMTYEQWKGLRQAESAAQTASEVSYTDMSNPLWRQMRAWSDLDGTAVDVLADKVNGLLSSSHGRAAQLWAKFESRLSMADPFHTSGAYFRPSDGVHMNLRRSLDNVGNRGTLSTWFHEFGHHIDNSARRAQGDYGFVSAMANDSHFGKTLKKEVDDYIKARQRADNDILRELKSNRDMSGLLERGFIGRWERRTVSDYYEVLDHLQDDEWLASRHYHFMVHTPSDQREDKAWSVFSEWAGVPQRNVPIQSVRDKVGREITEAGRSTQLAVGDLFEGATRGRCRDTFGHGASYWDSNGFSLAEEAFAEFYSAECIYSERPEILDTMIEYLPKSYEAYQQIVEMMLDA